VLLLLLLLLPTQVSWSLLPLPSLLLSSHLVPLPMSLPGLPHQVPVLVPELDPALPSSGGACWTCSSATR
jgi:hypothetical protein